jgi:hypothetical protein
MRQIAQPQESADHVHRRGLIGARIHDAVVQLADGGLLGAAAEERFGQCVQEPYSLRVLQRAGLDDLLKPGHIETVELAGWLGLDLHWHGGKGVGLRGACLIVARWGGRVRLSRRLQDVAGIFTSDRRSSIVFSRPSITSSED